MKELQKIKTGAVMAITLGISTSLTLAKDHMIHDVDWQAVSVFDQDDQIYKQVVQWNNEYKSQGQRSNQNSSNLTKISSDVDQPMQLGAPPPGYFRSAYCVSHEPKTGTGIPDGSITACVRRIEGLYQELFPGSLTTTPVIHMVSHPTDIHLLGRTQIKGDAPSINSHVLGKPRVSGQPMIEIYDGGDPNTIHHELAHGYDLCIRHMEEGNHFMEEGMAVCAEWILCPAACEFNIKRYLTPQFNKYNSPKELYDAIASRIEKDQDVVPPEDYQLAGFFMMQCIDLLGSKETIGILRCHDAHEVMRELGVSMWAKNLDEQKFWNTIYERSASWKR